MNTVPLSQKILLIDDDHALRLLFGAYLQLAGFTPLHACDGQEGIALLQEEKPALIVLDRQMPVLDGAVFLHWLRQDAGLEIPVLLLTGSANDAARREGMSLGASAVLFKPLTPEEFLAAVQVILRAA